MSVSAQTYHERTKHSPSRTVGGRMEIDNKPRPYKIYEDLPAVDLADAVRPSPIPALDVVAEHGSFPPAVPDLDAITQLCWLSAGITKTLKRGGQSIPFRAAACTGALYHVDLYLVSGDLTDLDAGVYHFDPRTLSLDVLREGDYRGVIAGATGNDSVVMDAPLSIVLTSTWWRNAWKYGPRTYRHAFWDSGTILANSLAIASSLEYTARVVTGFADTQVAELLGVHLDEEAPIEVIPIGGGDPVPQPREIEAIEPRTRQLSRRPRTYDLIEEAYTGSMFSEGAAAREWCAGTAGPVGRREPGDGDRISLEPFDDEAVPTRGLYETIRRRGSTRQYARDPVDFRAVSTVLDRAVRRAPMDVTAETPLTFNDCYMILAGVEDIPDGAYHFHPEAGEIELLQTGGFRREAGHLALDQRLGADASLLVFFLADLDAIVDVFGDRGYRAAQIEAAVVAGRLYLAAYAHRELGATGLTFYDDAVTEFFSPRAAGQTPMFLWTLGRPA